MESPIRTSKGIKNFELAFLLAQREMEAVRKGSTNPFFKSKYADLPSVIDVVKPALNDNGITYKQFPISEIYEGKVIATGCTTRLAHAESGEWQEGTFFLPVTENKPQSACGSLTYDRRYSLLSICGLPTDDDDAEGTMQRGGKKATKQPEPQKNITKDDRIATWNTLVDLGVWDFLNEEQHESLKKIENFTALGAFKTASINLRKKTIEDGVKDLEELKCWSFLDKKQQVDFKEAKTKAVLKDLKLIAVKARTASLEKSDKKEADTKEKKETKAKKEKK